MLTFCQMVGEIDWHGLAIVGYENKIVDFAPFENIGIKRSIRRCVEPANKPYIGLRNNQE